jgi:hypothetical protein
LTPSSSEWLNSRGCEYLSAIRELQPTFLGELPVPEKDLTELFLRIRQTFDPGLSDAVRACTAVAAVHAAVHASEDQSSYLEVFFERLGTSEEVTTWNQNYGPAVLRFLVDHFDEIDRPGGFRFVRPILNQAGISYRAMPAFAKFLSRLVGVSGMEFTRTEYEKCLRLVTSRFARRFLVEGPGFEFTRDAARILERIQSGLIPPEAIKSLPGYRFGFWTEVLKHFEARSSSDFRTGKFFSLPAEYLDIDTERLVLRFDEDGVASRSYLMDGKTVNFSVEPIRDGKLIHGTVRQPRGSYQNWSCEPWFPGKSDWALFRGTDGRLLYQGHATSPDVANITTVLPGQYLLIADENLSIPAKIVVLQGTYLEALGHDGSMYRIWSIELNPDTSIPELALRVSGSSVLSLSFEGQKKAIQATGACIFSGRVAKILVTGWTDAAAKNYTVLIDVGSGPVCMDEMIVQGVLQPKLPIPCQGRIWVEPRGRSRHSSASLPRLDFAVLSTSIRWQLPNQAFDLSEEVPVALETTADVHIDWKTPVVRLFQQHWKIKSGVRVAEGTIVTQGMYLPFSIRVPRTAILAIGSDPGLPIMWTDLEKGPTLRIEGLPNEPASLQLRDETTTWTLWDLGKIPSSGVVECGRQIFRDYLMNAQFAAAQIGVHSRGRTNWCNVWIASAGAIRLNCASASSLWQAWNLPVVGGLLKKIRSMEERPLEQIELDPRLLKVPLGQFLADVVLCAEAIDRTEVICAASPRTYATPALVSLVGSICSAEGKNEPASSKVPDFSIIPVRRIRNILEHLWDQKTWNERLPQIVAEWRKEVTGPIGSPPSRITKLPGGTMLTSAARKYTQVVPNGSPAQFNALIGHLYRCCDSTTDGICCALVSVLSELALYHSGRRSDVAQFQVGSFPGPLRRLQAQMKDLVRLCNRTKIVGRWPDGVGISEISPLRADTDLEQYLLREIEETSTTQ